MANTNLNERIASAAAEIEKYKKKEHVDYDELQQGVEQGKQTVSGTKGKISSAVDEMYYPMTSESYLDKMMQSAASFSYNPDDDPLYKQYRDMYSKESNLAAKNVFGLASSLTGGYGNSYAASAVSGVVSDYLDKLTAKSQELRDNAYEEHRDKISDYYTGYKEYAAIDNEKYEREQKAKEEDRAIAEAINKLAFDAADVGDYSLLEALGINTESLRDKDALEKAELYAKYGDYSGLEGAGIDISKLNEEERYELALMFAEYGDYSLLNSIGVNTSDRETEDEYNRLLTWARYLKALRW